jgi:peptide deformylase
MSFFGPKTLEIRIWGDPVLRRKADPIPTAPDPELAKLAKAMVATMRSADGVGLAAPQIGKSIRFVVLEVPMPDNGPSSPGEALLLPMMPLALINPEIVPITTGGLDTAEEGCLSVPKLYAKVQRPSKVILKALTLSGERLDIECGGFLARAIQHEIDHLDGVLFPDRLDKAEFERVKDNLNALEGKK